MVTFLKRHYPILLILLLAAILRFYRLSEYLEYLGDQGRDLVIIRRFLQTGDFFFIGPQTSIGNMYLGPYFYYLIAPSLWLANYSPVGPAAFVALIGIATVALIFYLCRRWFNFSTACIAAFLYAVSPVVIKYSTFSWNPNVAPFFSLLFIAFFYQAISTKNYRLLLLASLSFILALNCHYLCLLLLPPAGLFWLFHYRQHPSSRQTLLRQTLIAILIFLISLLPQFLFDFKHHWQNSRAFLNFFTQRETTVNLKAYKALPQFFPLFQQINTRLLFGKNEAFSLPLTLVFSLGLILLFFRLPQKNRPVFLFIFSWLVFGVTGLGLYKQHIYDHYFGFIFPAVFILAALSISTVFSLGLFPKIFTSVFFSTITILSLAENPLRYPPNRQLQTNQAIVDSIIAKSAGQPFNLALLAKQNYDPPYRYLLSLRQAPLYPVEEKRTNQLFVICEPWQITCEPINNPQTEVANYGWARLDSQWKINGIPIFRLVPYEN